MPVLLDYVGMMPSEKNSDHDSNPNSNNPTLSDEYLAGQALTGLQGHLRSMNQLQERLPQQQMQTPTIQQQSQQIPQQHQVTQQQNQQLRSQQQYLNAHDHGWMEQKVSGTLPGDDLVSLVHVPTEEITNDFIDAHHMYHARSTKQIDVPRGSMDTKKPKNDTISHTEAQMASVSVLTPKQNIPNPGNFSTSSASVPASSSSDSSSHLFSIRVIFFDSRNIPYGYVSPSDLRDLIVAECLMPVKIEYMSIMDALSFKDGYIIGDIVLVITWYDPKYQIKWSSASERIFFTGDERWNHWKQFYPDFDLIMQSQQRNNSEFPNQQNDSPAITSFRERLLTNPVTSGPYSSSEMKAVISYLKASYKIREYRNELSLKNFLRFVLQTFSKEIKDRLTAINQRTSVQHTKLSNDSKG